ncbi:hypothetical protein QE152_g15830 [Popillia japonica]|uniref:Uncharacterized protein n=1 Tax=Popillia japonica TaxID=7064 RepID=A0AAW1L6T5_POPJA
MEINSETFSPVFDSDGTVIIHDGNMLLQRLADPNVAPVAIASSSRGTENLKNCNISNVVEPEVFDAVEASKENILPGISDGKKIKASKDTPAPKTKRQTCSHGELFKEIAKVKEGKALRHKARMELQKEMLTILKEIVTILKDKK